MICAKLRQNNGTQMDFANNVQRVQNAKRLAIPQTDALILC